MKNTLASDELDLMPPDVCPNCGAELPPDARACPACGSDEKTGWSEQARYDDLGLPDDNFDYKDFIEREFGDRKAVPRGLHWAWWAVALFLLVAFLIWAL
jgi:ribosomal protein L40E